MQHKGKKTERRKRRIRLKIKGLTGRPRLMVFRSNKYIYAQIVDKEGKVLATASDKQFPGKQSKTKRAGLVGKLLAQKAVKKNIKEVVFDRGPYQYHGRVKALAEGAREGGLKF